MDESTRARNAASFGAVADVYDRTRPGYPSDAVHWLAPRPGSRVLELGAGTGKLTEALAAAGHRLLATDPSAPMLRLLRRRQPAVPVVQARAEQIPVHAGAMDVVVAAGAFHWFHYDKALPEITRVLVPGGTLALVWNHRDESVPWVRRLGRLLGTDPGMHDPVPTLEATNLFEGLETATFRHWQEVDRQGLLGLVSSRSYVATMDEPARSELLAKVGELYDEYGRGHDGMLLPYVTRCYRVRVSSSRHLDPPPPVDDGLLIDFP